MRSYGRGFVTAVDPYRDNGPDEDGDVVCAGCGGVFGDLDALRAAGLVAYPDKCRPCRAAEREQGTGGGGCLARAGRAGRVVTARLAVPGEWSRGRRF